MAPHAQLSGERPVHNADEQQMPVVVFRHYACARCGTRVRLFGFVPLIALGAMAGLGVYLLRGGLDTGDVASQVGGVCTFLIAATLIAIDVVRRRRSPRLL